MVLVSWTCRQKGIQALSAAESERSSNALQLRQGFAGSALELLTEQGAAMWALLVQLTQQLLQLLNGLVVLGHLQDT